MQKDLVPENEKGKQVDLAVEETCKTEHDAIALFEKACERLIHPNLWKSVTGSLGADFKKPGTAKLKTGDYIQIDIPGPGPIAGTGYDWVKVEAIEENESTDAHQRFGLKLAVCENPETPANDTAHFFAEGASSSFIIERQGQRVIASYHGRNELPNIKNAGIVDKVRNAAVALSAMAGISELQWKAFLKGLLAFEV
jgi:hypothetical protein